MANNTRTFSDFNISFVPNPITGDLTKVTDINSVAQAIMDLVQLNHYEKPFHPEIGGNVRKLLFEPADAVTSGLIATEITNVINNFEPRATLLGVYVDATNNGNGFNVTIEFSVANVTNPVTITTFLERLR